jgi:NAD(P)H dehydrogenase (quinone)
MPQAVRHVQEPRRQGWGRSVVRTSGYSHRYKTVAANVFTDPRTRGRRVAQSEVDSGAVAARTVMLSVDGNARAEMAGIHDGIVKVFCSPASGRVLGGVVVAPRASELILPISMAVDNQLSVDQLAHTITIYPSRSGSITGAPDD